MIRAGRRGRADWLSLAAAPTFAAMALLTAMTGTAHDGAGMPTMYLLMALFHLAPWLKLKAA